MRPASTLLSETSMLSDRCVRVRETAKIQPMMTEPMNDGLVVVDDGLIDDREPDSSPSKLR
jgi:hypothetical protein